MKELTGELIRLMKSVVHLYAMNVTNDLQTKVVYADIGQFTTVAGHTPALNVKSDL